MYLSETGHKFPFANLSRSEPVETARGAEPADETLLRRCAARDEAALQELVRRYQPRLGRFLYRLLASREDVEETLLGVFTQAWQHAGRFRYNAQVSTWLYRIALNQANDILRKRKRQANYLQQEQIVATHVGLDAEAEALAEMQRAEQAQTLNRALGRLSHDDRSLLTLYYYEQMEYDEMQAVTGLSYTVLKTRLARARQRLRGWMERETAEDREGAGQ